MTELSGIKGMTPSQINRHGAGILQAVIFGMEMPEERLPRFPRVRKNELVEGARERLKQLKFWRERRSSELGLEPGVLAPNWLLEAVADFNPATYSGLESVSGVRQWQIDMCGNDMIRIAAAVTTSEG
jgi:ribonuclease D